MPVRRSRHRAALLLAALAIAIPHAMFAQADSARASLRPDSARASDRAAARDSARARGLATVKVTGRADDLTGIARTASEGHVGAADLRLRPIAREGELLETVPGMIVTQHSGDGKANQYFVRGFNLDHGTDFSTRLEGMPLNSPTHAHGQGYTDLNFLIPELVDYIDYKLGVYHPELGDFGSAGGAELHLVQRLARPFVTTGAGENGLARIAAGASSRLGVGELLLAGEAKSYDGPWTVAEGIRKLSGVARYSWERGASRLSVLGMAYHNQWNASDQIPVRAVRDLALSRFGQIDSTDGGHTQRYSLSGTWRHAAARSTQTVQLFGIYSDLDLFSNFTYFLDDPVRGDQFNQHERRVVIGGNAAHAQPIEALGASHVVTIGLQTRTDLLGPVGLYRTQDRARYATTRRDDVTQTGAGLYVAAESRWGERIRSTLGLRGDAYHFRVASDLAANSGRRSAGILSPKASLAFAPTPTTELYVSGGLGFHSNDARGTTIRVDPVTREAASRVDPLVRSTGGEVGARVTLGGLRSTLSVWGLELDSELLFIGDGGSTEPSDRSSRSGVTWANFYRPIPQLALDADVSLARARFAGVAPGADHIPGALENVVAGGITWSPGAPGARGPFAAIRVRHFGSYPLVEDNSVRATATTLVNADAGIVVNGLRLQLNVLNLLASRASDTQYYYASRLSGEAGAGVDDVHFHPVEPRQLRLSLGWRF